VKDLLIILCAIVLLLVFLAFGKAPTGAKASSTDKTPDAGNKSDQN
jgi:hypothetical protein